MKDFKKDSSFVWKRIGDMNQTELKTLCAWAFYNATGLEPSLKQISLLESDCYTVWFRVGSVYMIIYSYESDNGFLKNVFVSDSHKCLNEQIV